MKNEETSTQTLSSTVPSHFKWIQVKLDKELELQSDDDLKHNLQKTISDLDGIHKSLRAKLEGEFGTADSATQCSPQQNRTLSDESEGERTTKVHSPQYDFEKKDLTFESPRSPKELLDQLKAHNQDSRMQNPSKLEEMPVKSRLEDKEPESKLDEEMNEKALETSLSYEVSSFDAEDRKFVQMDTSDDEILSQFAKIKKEAAKSLRETPKELLTHQPNEEEEAIADGKGEIDFDSELERLEKKKNAIFENLGKYEREFNSFVNAKSKSPPTVEFTEKELERIRKIMSQRNVT
jgi:hypothetical protein